MLTRARSTHARPQRRMARQPDGWLRCRNLRCLTPALHPQYQPRVAEYPAFADSFAAALAEAEAGAAGKRGGEAPPRAFAQRKARPASAPPPVRGAQPPVVCARGGAQDGRLCSEALRPLPAAGRSPSAAEWDGC